MKNLLILVCITITILLSGCATVVNGTTQDIPITSTPSNASVVINSMSYGMTPTSVKLKRNSTYMVEISKDGYISKTCQIIPRISGVIVGNLIYGGIIGGAVDMASGGGYTLEPSVVHVILQKLNDKQESQSDTDLDIYDILEVGMSRDLIISKLHKNGIVDYKKNYSNNTITFNSTHRNITLQFDDIGILVNKTIKASRF